MFTSAQSLVRTSVRAALVAALLPLGACYHQVIETGKPASPKTIEKPWQMSFVYGLVPPPALTSAADCPNGVAKVETQHSFMNGLVAGITFGLITPIQATITCAASGTASTDAQPVIRAGATEESQSAAIGEAVQRALATGTAVLVQF